MTQSIQQRSNNYLAQQARNIQRKTKLIFKQKFYTYKLTLIALILLVSISNAARANRPVLVGKRNIYFMSHKPKQLSKAVRALISEGRLLLLYENTDTGDYAFASMEGNAENSQVSWITLDKSVGNYSKIINELAYVKVHTDAPTIKILTTLPKQNRNLFKLIHAATEPKPTDYVGYYLNITKSVDACHQHKKWNGILVIRVLHIKHIPPLMIDQYYPYKNGKRGYFIYLKDQNSGSMLLTCGSETYDKNTVLYSADTTIKGCKYTFTRRNNGTVETTDNPCKDYGRQYIVLENTNPTTLSKL